MSDYPKIDDFLDAVEDSTAQTWNSDIQHLYTESLKECVFADRVVKEMLPHEWEDWVIEGIAKNTPKGKWMSSMAAHFWADYIQAQTSIYHIGILLTAGCALEYSNTGQHYLAISGKSQAKAITAIAKRLVQTDDENIVDVLIAASKHTNNVGSTLFAALVDAQWDFNAVWENPQIPQFQTWMQLLASNGGLIFASSVGRFNARNLEEFSTWVVDFMIEENKSSQDMHRFDHIFEQMPLDVAQKWIDHLSNHSPNPKLYGPLVSALLQNKQLRDVISEGPSHEVVRRRM